MVFAPLAVVGTVGSEESGVVDVMRRMHERRSQREHVAYCVPFLRLALESSHCHSLPKLFCMAKKGTEVDCRKNQGIAVHEKKVEKVIPQHSQYTGLQPSERKKVMKSKSQDTRNKRFHEAYPEIFDELRSQLFVRGRNGRIGGWVSDSRSRTRKLAREMARHKERIGA
jgi:hypothetical protein